MSVEDVLAGRASWAIAQGDCREVLRSLPTESVHCAVTSPPYWGLRDYGVQGQLGLEETFEEYLDTMVAVFEEVRRVLRSDATCWINMGDSHASNSPGSGPSESSTLTNPDRQRDLWHGRRKPKPGRFKLKDKMLQPHRLAIALCDAGWWVRQDNVWRKPNPMPESTNDRTTTQHEYVFHLAKSPRYFYDGKAIEEPVTGGAHARGTRGHGPKALKAPAGWDTSQGEGGHNTLKGNGRYRARANASFLSSTKELVASRNARSVWDVPTEPFSEAHFATFPVKIPEKCIRAGTSAGGACASCAAPFERVTGEPIPTGAAGSGNKQHRVNDRGRRNHVGSSVPWAPSVTPTLSWVQSCACAGAGAPRPCVVLDPFAGAATTGLAALQNGRAFIGIELNPEYVRIAERRLGAWRGQQRLDPRGLARWGLAE